MPGTPKRLAGPVALSATLTTNILNGAGGSASMYDVVRHIHVANKTAGAVSFSLWVGATGGNVAGTELFNAVSVGANSVFDAYLALRLDSTDFLVGGASAGTSLTITVEGDRNVV
jgi:hypothetical protein